MEALGSPHRRGLVLGKFLPPHLGHVSLIDHARARVDHLIVLVCSLPGEPIPGELRAAWMRELFPQVEVVHVTDENPSLPEEHPRFWEIWTGTIRRYAGALDVIFTSEAYGDELARRLGIRHELVDLERKQVPISGTAIRQDPWRHWEFLPGPVRPHFVRRVTLTGSESTGKTTLARELAERFGTCWTPEYGREYVARLRQPLAATDVEPIARGQVAAEEAGIGGANRVCIQDTDLISTVIYSQHYYGGCPDWIVQESHRRRSDLYLLMDIDVPWIADAGQRDLGHLREEMHRRFRQALQDRGAAFVEIGGSWSERRERAFRAVEELMARPWSPGPRAVPT
jgi:HTH-type transcriptional regulator, transcriptional repressor of NAD biosynthesis genes